eukprot:SAG31_NODE_28396_length_410_cov_7.623794_1_plen_57_part_01
MCCVNTTVGQEGLGNAGCLGGTAHLVASQVMPVKPGRFGACTTNSKKLSNIFHSLIS